MTKYIIDIRWSETARSWIWAVYPAGSENSAGFRYAAFRWLAKRRAINRLLDIKAGKDEAERKKDLALKYEVEL